MSALFQTIGPTSSNYMTRGQGSGVGHSEKTSIQEFSIFADDGIGKLLVEKKAEWINKRVNVYLKITDRGLTPWTNIGLVVKVERLNEKGKIEKTLPEV